MVDFFAATDGPGKIYGDSIGPVLGTVQIISCYFQMNVVFTARRLFLGVTLLLGLLVFGSAVVVVVVAVGLFGVKFPVRNGAQVYRTNKVGHCQHLRIEK